MFCRVCPRSLTDARQVQLHAVFRVSCGKGPERVRCRNVNDASRKFVLTPKPLTRVACTPVWNRMSLSAYSRTLLCSCACCFLSLRACASPSLCDSQASRYNIEFLPVGTCLRCAPIPHAMHASLFNRHTVCKLRPTQRTTAKRLSTAAPSSLRRSWRTVWQVTFRAHLSCLGCNSQLAFDVAGRHVILLCVV